ncbi:MAG: helix-hairpin-helix domain-containing protein [Microcoleus vaginatus WJT46-NPBG5]|jgi:DNA uptake protein ComE-like DNA-binding protein|nr:helix-hairpin-helix domain-containing protein [Microcoleus vaginatus WJT46-NPBG5]
MLGFRSLFLTVATAGLVTLAGCNNANTTNNTSTETTPATTAASNTETTKHDHGGGKKKVNINTAILSELDKFEAQLGVPALSNKIQASRPYGSPEDLVSKKVITQQQFDQIKDQVTIEDIVLTGEAKDVDYMTKLGLMKGHLIVAKELLDQQKPEQAEPHIGHPVEEIYVDVEEQLQERNVKEFKTTLISLQDQLKSNPKNEKIGANFETSMQAIDGAIEGISEAQRTSPKFVLQVINGLLEAADAEYGAAVANNKITADIEYQDSRGFVNYANTLYKNISQQMAKENPDAHKQIQTSLTELTKAWPSVTAPAAPVKTPEQVSQLIATIGQNSQKVVK